MTRSYKQLDILERQRIYFLRKQGFSLRKIASVVLHQPYRGRSSATAAGRGTVSGAAQGQAAGHRGVPALSRAVEYHVALRPVFFPIINGPVTDS